jgi:formate hydrogenlyase subunit 3/multisubunit Na+/H+ antiporter MnhD subunit
MPLATPFFPVLILLVGAVVLLAAGRWVDARIARVVALVVSAGFLLSCVLLRLFRPAGSPLSLWRPGSLFGVELGYFADGVSQLFLVLMATVVLIAVLLSDSSRGEETEDPASYGVMFLVLAGASSAILAGDLLTLCLSWGLLDLALLFFGGLNRGGQAASRNAFRVLLINYLGGVSLLGALVVLQGATLSLQAAPLPTRVVSLVLLATLVRLGLYPAFVPPSSAVESGLRDTMVRYAAPLSVGGYLLVRVLGFTAVSALPGRELVLVMGSLAVVLSPFPLWFETEVRKTGSYIVLHHVGHMAMAAAIAVPLSPMIIVAQAISLVVALALLSGSEAGSLVARGRLDAVWTRCCTLIAVATLVGAPLTLGFVGRQLLYTTLWEGDLGPLILLSLVGNSFLVAPLLKKGLSGALQSESEDGRAPVLLACMSALAVPLIVLGLHPPLLRTFLGAQSAAGRWPGLLDVVYSPDTPVTLVLFGCTLVSLAAGYLMYRMGQVFVARAGVSLETLRMIAEMEWFFAAVSWTGERVALVLEAMGSFFEERRSPGWIMVFAILAALLILSS